MMVKAACEAYIRGKHDDDFRTAHAPETVEEHRQAQDGEKHAHDLQAWIHDRLLVEYAEDGDLQDGDGDDRQDLNPQTVSIVPQELELLVLEPEPPHEKRVDAGFRPPRQGLDRFYEFHRATC